MKEFGAVEYKKLKGDYNDSDEKELIDLIAYYDHKKILDIGCGDGVLTNKIQTKLPDSEVVGIDNSVDQIIFAKKHAPHIDFECASILDYKTDSRFDLVFSFYAFPHMPKSHILPSLKNVRDILKGGGHMLLYTNICDFEMENVSKSEQESCDITFFDTWESQINLTNLKEMNSIIKQAGFYAISNKKQKEGVQVKKFGEMFSWSFVLK